MALLECEPLLRRDFHFALPAELIAQRPPARRGDAGLAVVDRATGAVTWTRVRALAELLGPRDLLVTNDTRVLPARLIGRRARAAGAAGNSGAADGGAVGTERGAESAPPGARVEALVLGPFDGWESEALVTKFARLRTGDRLHFAGGAWSAVLTAKGAGGRVRLAFAPTADGTLAGALARFGRTPLPPYIRRDEGDDDEEDRARYQTVFARADGSVAAPTAGLHFDEELLARLEARGVARAAVTLHVGPGTFAPAPAGDLSTHRLHAEQYRLDAATAARLNAHRAAGGRLLAVGTTVARVLETAADEQGRLHPGAGWTDCFLRPGHRFRVVDALLTNFHLPESTLLMLVAAFWERPRVLALYEEAVARRWRFFSYGDACLFR